MTVDKNLPSSYSGFLALVPIFILLAACGGGGSGSSNDGSAQTPDPQPVVHSVPPGDYYRTTFTVTAGSSYQLELNQHNCIASGEPADNNACCALMVSEPGAGQPSWEEGWHDMVAGPSSTLRLPYDPADDGALNVAVYGVHPTKSCQFEKPTIGEAVDTTTTLALLDGSGQTGKSYQLASTSIDGSNYFLRDISRRRNMDGAAGNTNSGQLQNWATLTTQRITGIRKSDEFPLMEYQAGDSFWGGDNSDLADAHAGTALVHDFWLEKLGINSYDGQGSPMFAFQDLPYPWVEAQFCGNTVPPNTLYNAFYISGAIYYSTYGDNLKPDIYGAGGRPPVSFSAALDVTAHEWAHALTDRFSKLNYERQPGALNEAFSDWMGVAVEWYRDKEVNWVMGEELGEPLRDLSDPKRFGQPDTYKGENWAADDTLGCARPDVCENDYCGVHTNSGVPNKMFYLLTEGGEHNGITVQGIGIEKAIKIATQANQFHWAERYGFLSARWGMEDAAEELYGAGSSEQLQVGRAWQAVGVGGE